MIRMDWVLLWIVLGGAACSIGIWTVFLLGMYWLAKGIGLLA
jgi:hypothetical protein